jgi:hypothetical protein
MDAPWRCAAWSQPVALITGTAQLPTGQFFDTFDPATAVQSTMSPVDIFTDLLLAALAGAVGYGVARIAGEVWAKLILEGEAVASLRAKVKRCSVMVPALGQRRSRLRVSLLQAEARRRNIERQVDQLQRQIADLQSQDDDLIRIIGHRRPGSRLFKAVMVNKHVQTAMREGRPHGLLDNSWARPQDVEVWANGLPDAKFSLNSRFPASLGFVLIELRETDESETAGQTGTAA